MKLKTAGSFTGLVGGALLALTGVASAVEAVVVVPYSQRDPLLPHPAHSNAPITLKAIVRGATCDAGYDVTWDVNRDGLFTVAGDGAAAFYTRTGSVLYDIGRTYTVPVVPSDQRVNVGVQVVSRCGVTASGAYRLYVYAWEPSGDSANWTADQIQIMGSMAVEETMWKTHRMTYYYNNDQGSTAPNIMALYGTDGGYRPYDALALWTMAINGHIPAYPPGSVNWHGMARPPAVNGVSWDTSNDARWNNDPYAETTLRWTNDLIYQAIPVGIDPADEANTCGYNGNGTEAGCVPLDNTDNSSGIRFAADSSYWQGMIMGGLPTALPAMSGVPVQVTPPNYASLGTDAGARTYNWFIQEGADLLGWMQMDGGDVSGGWWYDSGGCCNDGSTTQWGMIGMESAEVAGHDFGVIVNNRHKYRVAESVFGMHDGTGSACYRTWLCGENQLTGGAILGARWIDVNNMPSDGSVPYNGYNIRTKAQLKAAYDGYVAFAGSIWASSYHVSAIGWWSNFWSTGTYNCNMTDRPYNTDNNNARRCGNTYALYSHQKGYRTGSPALTTINGHDWFREFSSYYIRAQDRSVADYPNFGRVIDGVCQAASVGCNYAGPGGAFTVASGGLVMTPTIFNPKPVAAPLVNNGASAVAVEGCAGGAAVNFTHALSFHPNPSRRIILYQWDVDSTDGLWWVTNAAPDYQTPNAAATFTYTYPRQGVYTATLRVVDDGNPATNSQQTDQKTVTVTVQAGANLAPTAAAGGAYLLERGANLQLAGSATDPNTPCGDTITVAWDLNNANTWNAANAANGAIAWASFQNFADGAPIPLRIRVTDRLGLVSINATTVTIFPRDPVAVGRANPNPAGCNQVVTFDGSQSYSGGGRIISTYQWNVDGVAGYEGSGATFTYTYSRYGTYAVTLHVVDNAGHANDVTFNVAVNQGNQAPVARTSQPNYDVLEGDPLTLDGSGSTDANLACGDSIVTYAWDVNGNGAYNDAVDVANNARPVIPWATLVNLNKFADPVTGLPKNTINLRVTDSFGATATIAATITIYQAAPIARVVQSPNPAPINLVTGFSNPTLNAQESRSPIPGMQIASYDWDLDNNGTFEVINSPALEFRRTYLPVPAPNNLPQVFVRLRVTDTAGRSTIVTYQVIYRVPPTPPTADADPTDPPEQNYHILLGDPVSLDPRQSFDPDTRDFGDYITTYRFDVNAANVNNPVFDHTTLDPNGQKQNVVLNLTAAELAAAGIGINAPGAYPVVLEVADLGGLTGRDTATLNVYAVNPVAVATANPNPAACGDRVSFDGSRSDHPHPAINIVRWEWDLDGNGQYNDDVGPNVIRQYNQFTFAPINVGLKVTDNLGHSGTTTIALNVTQGNHAPVAAPGGPYTIVRGEGLTLRGNASSDPDSACGDAVVDYAWDFGNNGSIEIPANANPQQVVTSAQLQAWGINAAGVYTVALRVRDRFGVTATNTAVINVINGPTAIAVANPNSIACNANVTFDGSASTTDAPANDPNFALVTYKWDMNGNGAFNDPVDAVGKVVTRAIAGQGANVTVGLQVTDASGHVATTTVTVTINVQNLAPIANAGGPYATGRVNGGAFAGVSLDGRNSRDPNEPCDSIALYKWDTDNDGIYGSADNAVAGSPTGRDYEGAVIAAYKNPNWVIGIPQTVGLIVCDSKNPQLCSPPAFATIEVQAEAPPQGEIVSPRVTDANFCGGANPFNVTYHVGDPESDPVTVIVYVGGLEVARQVNVPTNPQGTPDRTIAVNPVAVPDGIWPLEIVFDDLQGGRQRVNAGGAIMFDHTAPAVVIGATPVAGTCYSPNQIPAPVYQATDALDPNPVVNQSTANNGCGRTLTVTATDRCGNVGSATRAYLTADQVQVAVNGVADGQLVAPGVQVTWTPQGAANCAGQISATLAKDGGAPGNYVQGAAINPPGAYTLSLNIPNCQGVARQQLMNFVVNAPPVAVPITAQHPNRDPAAANAYIVTEGGNLVVDASESLRPEAMDSITGYRWDFGNDNVWESPGGAAFAAAATAVYPTSNNGVFQNKVEVRDSLNATNQAQFRVTVTDVSPTVRIGGPYVVAQGVQLDLDGSGSTAGSPADLLSAFRWDFADGVIEGGAPAQYARWHHTWTDNGVYNVVLRVSDEDNFTEATTTVTVRDVDPVIQGVDLPNPAYEVTGMHFRANATAGAPNDPITRAEWDFDGDGVVDLGGPWPTFQDVTWAYERAGNYNVSVKLYDKDSNVTVTNPLRVNEVSFSQLLTETRTRIAAVAAAGPAIAAGRVANTGTFLTNGLWGETHNYRGNTWQAFDTVTFDIARSAGSGGYFGLPGIVAATPNIGPRAQDNNLLWFMSRAFLREIGTLRTTTAAQIQANPDPFGNAQASLARADLFIARMNVAYNDPTYRAQVSSAAGAILSRDFFANAYEAYFYLKDATDPFNRFDLFSPAPAPDAVTKVAESNRVNTNLITGMTELQVLLQAYINEGNPADVGPGRQAVSDALSTLTQRVMPLLRQNIGLTCDAAHPCVSDTDALHLELYLMDLINQLYTAQSQGTFVRAWQHGLMLAVKFRIEISLLRVEYVCGKFSPTSRAARTAQATGLALVDQYLYEDALRYYMANNTRCTVIKTYNACLVPAARDPVRTPAEAVPGFCPP